MFAIKSCSVILKDLRCNQKIYEQNIIPFSHASFPLDIQSVLHSYLRCYLRVNVSTRRENQSYINTFLLIIGSPVITFRNRNPETTSKPEDRSNKKKRRRKMMSANDYPKFSRSDIITVLREANIASVKDADLKNPTFDSVSDLYTRILIYLDVLTEYVFLSLNRFH